MLAAARVMEKHGARVERVSRRGEGGKPVSSRRAARLVAFLRAFGRRRRVWWVLGLVVLVAVAAVWLWAGRRAASPAGGAAGFRAVAVRRGPIEVVASADGVLQAVDRRELRAGSGGRVVQVLVKEGDTVQPGQLLLELDSEDVRARLERAEVALEQARRELETLVRNRQKLTVRAPVAGRVVSLRVAEGQRLSGGSLVASIVDDRHLEVTA